MSYLSIPDILQGLLNENADYGNVVVLTNKNKMLLHITVCENNQLPFYTISFIFTKAALIERFYEDFFGKSFPQLSDNKDTIVYEEFLINDTLRINLYDCLSSKDSVFNNTPYRVGEVLTRAEIYPIIDARYDKIQFGRIDEFTRIWGIGVQKDHEFYHHAVHRRRMLFKYLAEKLIGILTYKRWAMLKSSDFEITAEDLYDYISALTEERLLDFYYAGYDWNDSSWDKKDDLQYLPDKEWAMFYFTKLCQDNVDKKNNPYVEEFREYTNFS